VGACGRRALVLVSLSADSCSEAFWTLRLGVEPAAAGAGGAESTASMRWRPGEKEPRPMHEPDGPCSPRQSRCMLRRSGSPSCGGLASLNGRQLSGVSKHSEHSQGSATSSHSACPILSAGLIVQRRTCAPRTQSSCSSPVSSSQPEKVPAYARSL